MCLAMAFAVPGGTVEREVLLETLRRLVFGCDSARKLISSFWLVSVARLA